MRVTAVRVVAVLVIGAVVFRLWKFVLLWVALSAACSFGVWWYARKKGGSI